MIKATLKTILFVSIVLLFGQLKLGRATVGEVFYTFVSKSARQIQHTEMFASLTDTSWLKSWFGNVYPPDRSTDEAKENEEMTQSDRESILQLLD